MPDFSLTGGITFGSGVGYIQPITPITATAGSVTSVSGNTTTAITAFFPFAQVQNGTPPYTYFVSAGVLPTGIAIDSSNGIVYGRPTATQGLGNVTFSVRDSNFVSAATTVIVGFTVV